MTAESTGEQDDAAPRIPDAQAVVPRILAQEGEQDERDDPEQHEPLDRLVAQAARVDRPEAGQQVVVVIEEQEEADHEKGAGRERGEAQAEQVERPVVDRGRRMLGRVAGEKRANLRTGDHCLSLCRGRARTSRRLAGPRADANVALTRPQSALTRVARLARSSRRVACGNGRSGACDALAGGPDWRP